MIKPHRWPGCSQWLATIAAPSSVTSSRRCVIPRESLPCLSICWTTSSLPHKISPTLPLRACVSPYGFCVTYVSPYGLCVTLSGIALSLLVLLCLSAMYSSVLDWSPSVELPLTATQITSSIFSANHAPEKLKSLISWCISNWPSNLLLYFSCWWINGHDLISNQRLRLKRACSSSLRTFSPIFLLIHINIFIFRTH